SPASLLSLASLLSSLPPPLLTARSRLRPSRHPTMAIADDDDNNDDDDHSSPSARLEGVRSRPWPLKGVMARDLGT
ncbi:hypothetical protein FALBO_17335, partial [Fusarium albosuccineum]